MRPMMPPNCGRVSRDVEGLLFTSGGYSTVLTLVLNLGVKSRQYLPTEVGKPNDGLQSREKARSSSACVRQGMTYTNFTTP